MLFKKKVKHTHNKQIHHPEKARRERESLFTALSRNIDKFFDKSYRICYYMGAQLVRKERLYSRRLETRFNRFRDKLSAKRIKRREARKRFLKTKLKDTLIPIVTIGERFKNYGVRLRKAASVNIFCAFFALLVIFCEIIRTMLRAIGGILNYAAPIAAFVLLFSVISHFNNLTFALEVNYNGQNIGYIKDESVFEAAEKEVSKRIIYEDTTVKNVQAENLINSTEVAKTTTEANVLAAYVAKIGDVKPQLVPEGNQVVSMPQYTLSVVKPYQITDQDTLTNRIIEAGGNEITQASGLYIEGDFKGATTEPNRVLDIMSSMLDQYETGSSLESIHFINKIEVKDGLYPVESVESTEAFSKMLQGNVSGETYYTVVTGDSPLLITNKTGVPLVELNAMNPDLSTDFVPGKQLLISRSVPMMKVKVTRRETHTEEIPFKTEYTDNPKLVKGLEQTVKKGVLGSKSVEEDVVYIDGVAISKTIFRETVILEPVSEVVDRGTNVPKLPSSSGSSSGSSSSGSSGGTVTLPPANAGFIWPVIGGGHNYVSMPIWGYFGHTGTDIAAPSGTTVVASMSGTVIKATQTAGGYGRHIIIQHANGMTTLYGHNSALYVKVGDVVQQGQRIAAVGRTGNASGNHLHFEIRSNKQYLDAKIYIGSTSPY